MAEYRELSEFDARLMSMLIDLEKAGQIEISDEGIRLTAEGFEAMATSDREGAEALLLAREGTIPTAVFVKRLLERADEERLGQLLHETPLPGRTVSED